jgi:hypothetical protein
MQQSLTRRRSERGETQRFFLIETPRLRRVSPLRCVNPFLGESPILQGQIYDF